MIDETVFEALDELTAVCADSLADTIEDDYDNLDEVEHEAMMNQGAAGIE